MYHGNQANRKEKLYISPNLRSNAFLCDYQVSWVEHTEAPTSAVHGLYKSLVNSGMAFGALRWLCSLQRQCERIASVLANVPPRDMSGEREWLCPCMLGFVYCCYHQVSVTESLKFAVIPNPEGRRSMLKLSERMTNNFCSGVSASTSHTWVTLAGSNNGGGADDVRVLIRKSVDDPGRPPGIVLSAATSLWLPVPPAQVFNFLRDERFRTEVYYTLSLWSPINLFQNSLQTCVFLGIL